MTFDRRTLFVAYGTVLAALFAGLIWRTQPVHCPNDASRWDTVWSLVEYGTYQIFDTQQDANAYAVPVQYGTIDKIVVDDGTEPRAYSSKPPLLPTVIAGYVWLLKHVVSLRVDKDAMYLYAPATLLVLNLAPFLIFLTLYRRYLDRFSLSEFTWTYCLLAGGLGTLVTGYLMVLNNHSVAACFGFFSAYLLIGIWYDDRHDWWRFALAGLFAGWTGANELPAGVLVLVGLAITLAADWKWALTGYLPAAAVVLGALLLTNYLAIGTIEPAYLQKTLYDYENSYWTDPDKKSAIDALNDHPESYWLYFVHMTVGHHGLFSLTPIWLLAVLGCRRPFDEIEDRPAGLHWPILLISLVVFVFFWRVTDQRNYGGFCHGLRWLVWLCPLWLCLLPAGVERIASTPNGRRVAWILLLWSIFSMADTIPRPFDYAWLHRALRWLDLVAY